MSNNNNNTVQFNLISKDDYPLIPQEAFLYFPQQQEIKIGEGKTGLRRIFEGQVVYDQYEQQQLNDFQQYLTKKQASLIPWWDDAKKLRFLYANQFKYDKALKTMEVHQEWRNTNLPPKESNEIKQFLDQGAFYVHGRDHRFRPILVINVKRLDFKNIKIELILESMTYFFEFILNKMMLPGQIENWVVILDLGNIGLSSLPISGLKQIMGYLSSNYRSRMFATYVVNTPSSIFIPYKIVKGFLEEQTIKKISFYSNKNPKPLFTHCHPSQIESTYSGTSNSVTESFWPPKVISNTYQLDEDLGKSLFQSKEEYNRQYKSGMLKKNLTLKEIVQNSSDTNQVNPESVHLTSFTQEKKNIQSTFNFAESFTPQHVQESEYKKMFNQQRSLNVMPTDGFHSLNNSQQQQQIVGKPQTTLGAFGKEFQSNHQIEEFDEEDGEKSNLNIKELHSQAVKSSHQYDQLSVANEMYIEKQNDEPSVNLVIVKRNYFNQNISNLSFYSQTAKYNTYHSNFTKILQSLFISA